MLLYDATILNYVFKKHKWIMNLLSRRDVDFYFIKALFNRWLFVGRLVKCQNGVGVPTKRNPAELGKSGYTASGGIYEALGY